MGIDSLRFHSVHAKMYLGVNSLRFRSESIPMGIMLRGGICLPVTPVADASLSVCCFQTTFLVSD